MFLSVLLYEWHRVVLLRITVVCNVLSLFLNKITLIVLIALHKLTVEKFQPLIKTISLQGCPIFLMCISTLGMVINIWVLYLNCLAFFPYRRQRKINTMTICVYVYFFYVVTTIVACMLTSHMMVIIGTVFEGGLYTSMTRYGIDIDIKKRIDHLQMSWKCCGDISFNDWFSISWIRGHYINMNDAMERQELRTDGRYRTDSVPFSCCDPNSLRPCIFEHVKDNSRYLNYIFHKDHTLYPDGCREVMIWHIQNIFRWLLGMNIMSILLNVGSIINFRYIQTSSGELLKQKYFLPDAPAVGYIVGDIVLPEVVKHLSNKKLNYL